MHDPITPATADFIHRLPKTETHLHIEGALPYELLQKLDPEKFSLSQNAGQKTSSGSASKILRPT